MQTELLLDHPTILANQARPIHFALRFTAPAIAAACCNLRPATDESLPSSPAHTTITNKALRDK